MQEKGIVRIAYSMDKMIFCGQEAHLTGRTALKLVTKMDKNEIIEIHGGKAPEADTKTELLR